MKPSYYETFIVKFPYQNFTSQIVKFSYGKLVCMRARDVTLNKSELQRGCENANKICNGDVNCIREDFKSMDYDSSKYLTNQNQF